MFSEHRDGRSVAQQGSRLPRWLGALAAVAVAAFGVSACGSDNNSGSGGGGSGAGNVSKASGAELAKMLGYSSDDLNALKGKTIKMGAILALERSRGRARNVDAPRPRARQEGHRGRGRPQPRHPVRGPEERRPDRPRSTLRATSPRRAMA